MFREYICRYSREEGIEKKLNVSYKPIGKSSLSISWRQSRKKVCILYSMLITYYIVYLWYVHIHLKYLSKYHPYCPSCQGVINSIDTVVTHDLLL